MLLESGRRPAGRFDLRCDSVVDRALSFFHHHGGNWVDVATEHINEHVFDDFDDILEFRIGRVGRTDEGGSGAFRP